MKKSKKFVAFLDSVRENNNALDIGAFLIMPIQRIPRYELLLRELKRNTDPASSEFNELQQAFGKIQAIAVHVNEHQRHIDNMTKLLDLQDRIEGHDFELLQAHRRLLREGTLVQKLRGRLSHKKTRVVFLFSDILLWTSKEGSYISHIDLSDAVVQDNAKHPDVSFELAGSKATDGRQLVFRCQDAAEKESWVRSIDDAVNALWQSLYSRLDDEQKQKLSVRGADNKNALIKHARSTLRKQKYVNKRSDMHQFLQSSLNALSPSETTTMKTKTLSENPSSIE